jgi:hypothetical protein
MKLEFNKFTAKEQPNLINFFTLFGVVASLIIVGFSVVLLTMLYAPFWVFEAMFGFVIVAAWVRFYRLGYITFKNKDSTNK